MKTEIVKEFTNSFDEHLHTTENGLEFWFARELQHLLGYTKWDNFVKVITKAKNACESSENNVSNHFPDVGKTIEMPKGASKEIQYIMLTRYMANGFNTHNILLPPLEKQKEIADHITEIRAEAQQLKERAKEVLKQAKKEIEKILLN